MHPAQEIDARGERLDEDLAGMERERKALPYAALSAPLDEIGRMLGGWSGQIARQTQAPHGSGAGK
jgi:hypothetical protein